MNIIDFYTKKNEIIVRMRKNTLDRSDAAIELNLLNAEAKKAELEVALLNVDQILNESFTGGETAYPDDEVSYEEEESYEESTEDDY